MSSSSIVLFDLESSNPFFGHLPKQKTMVLSFQHSLRRSISTKPSNQYSFSSLSLIKEYMVGFIEYIQNPGKLYCRLPIQGKMEDFPSKILLPWSLILGPLIKSVSKRY